MKFAAVLGVILFVITNSSTQNATGRALTFIGSYGGRSFFQAENTTANFETSQNRCTSQGLTLAKVHSADELKYLKTVLQASNYWVAGKSTGSFEWTDGSTVTVPLTLGVSLCLYIGNAATYLFDSICTSSFYTLCNTL